jgi:hypothetical protein
VSWKASSVAAGHSYVLTGAGGLLFFSFWQIKINSFTLKKDIKKKYRMEKEIFPTKNPFQTGCRQYNAIKITKYFNFIASI